LFTTKFTKHAAFMAGAYLVLGTSPAHAYTNLNVVCSGHAATVRWGSAPVQMIRDPCSIPAGSDEHWAYNHAIQEWWSVRHIFDGNWIENPCAPAINNSLNETWRVAPSVISGLAGLTTWRADCNDPNFPHFREADIRLNNTYSYAVPDESFWGYGDSQQGQVAILHELGHALGLDHFVGMNIMRTSLPLPLAGGGSVPFPDDAAGIRHIYAGGFNTNLFVSAQWNKTSGTTNAIIATANDIVGSAQSNNCVTFDVCRGAAWAVRYTIMNNGNTDVTNTGFRVFLSTAPIGGTTFNMFSTVATVNRENGFTEQRNMLIPNVPNGLYWIQWEIDSNHTLTEWDETDNVVHNCQALNVRC
jgi:hypothetical protein